MPDERFDSRPTGEPRVPEASSRCVTSLCHVDDQETGLATASQPCPIGRTPSAMSTVLLTRWAEGSCHADQEGIAADPCARAHTIVAREHGPHGSPTEANGTTATPPFTARASTRQRGYPSK